MKLCPTAVSVALLAVAGWAALPAPFQGATCAAPSPVAKPSWKHGQPEYNDLLAATKATDPAQKAKLAADFVQKYPDSDYKATALQTEMGAESQIPAQQAGAVKTAEELIKSQGVTADQLLSGYVLIAYVEPNISQANDPNLAADMATLSQAATCGQQLLSSGTAAQQAQYSPILTKAQGFAQLNTKNYDGAIATLTKAVQANPKDALSYYWMGIAAVSKPTPDFNAGLFDLAKASVLSPGTQAISSYLNTVYTTYTGGTDGLQDVITAATNNATPPQGFNIPSKVDRLNAANMAAYQAALEKQKNQLPPPDSFPGIEARLKRPELAADEWKQVKGQGYELDGIVTAVTAKSVDVAVGAKDTDASPTPDVHLLLFTPLTTKRPKVGEKVTISGAAASFKPNPPDANVPFLLTMDQGTIKGYSPEGGKQGGQ
ncbi:MAG TPA: hypothetical protein VN690_10545 [Terriglobales bacterium]|nr:hypothetical protein [Terriglobales bacterium]